MSCAEVSSVPVPMRLKDNSLLSYSVQRGVVVEAKIASVENVIGPRLPRQVIQRLEIACARSC
jgi:hypothetical protein